MIAAGDGPWYVPDVRTLRLHSRPVSAGPAAGWAAASATASEQSANALTSSLQELVLAAAMRNAAASGAFLGSLGEVLLVDALAAASKGPLRGIAATAGLRRSLERAFQAAASLDLKPAAFAAVARRIGKGETASARSSEKLTEVAHLYRQYREHLGARRLDTALLWHKGLLALAELPVLAGVAELELHGLHRVATWDAVPTPHALMAALDELGRSRRVRVVLPQVEDRPLLVQALAPIYDALFRKHELNIDELRVPLGPYAVGDSPWARFLRGLFLKTGTQALVAPGELGESQLSCSALPSPRAEAQLVARRIRDLLDAGSPPGTLAVIAPSPERRQRLIEALLRYKVPVYAPPAVGLLGEARQSVLPPPLQALLGLLDTLAQGLPREGLIKAMTSRYLRFPGPLQSRPWQVARALREAGIRELRAPEVEAVQNDLWTPGTPAAPGAPPAGSDYRQRLEQWLRQQAAQLRQKRAAAPQPAPVAPLAAAALPEPLLAVSRQIDAVIRELATLPDTASVAEHCAALRRLADRLQLGPAALREPDSLPLMGGDEGESGDEAPEAEAAEAAELLASECLAQARDLAAVAALHKALDELPRLGRRLGLTAQLLPRTRFAALLRAALLRLLPPAGPLGTAGAGVFVGELAQVGGQSFAHLFITGLLDGELPPRQPEDAVLDDDDRRALNRLCDAPIWPLAQQEGERAPLLFAEALAHSQAAHLSWPTADEEGRPLLRSSLVDAVLQAAALPWAQRWRVPLLPWPDQARHRSELWARATLETRRAESLRAAAADALIADAAPAERFGPDAPRVRLCSPALLGALAEHDRARAARLRARIDMEQLRTRWFAGVASGLAPLSLDALAGPFVGRLARPDGVQSLQPRLPGGKEHPLSASALEDYAKCPFRFFVRRVLKAAPLTESGEDLDPLASGRLHHAVLERFFLGRRDAGRLPLRGDADDRAAMEQAIDDELRRFCVEERTGHPQLLQVRVRRLRADLQRLLQREASTPPDPDCVPARFEHRFGPLAIRSADEHPDDGEGKSGMALHIEGIIDRVDLGPGRAVVLDYKAGRLVRYEELLRSQLLSTSFQLPLYAAALTVDESLRQDGRPLTEVAARYYSLRQGRVSRALHDPEMISLDAAVRKRAPEHNVAEVAYRLWRRLRAGDFRVAPRTCEGCGLEATCRIPVAPTAAVESGDEAAAGSADSGAQRTPPPSAASPTPDWQP